MPASGEEPFAELPTRGSALAEDLTSQFDYEATDIALTLGWRPETGPEVFENLRQEGWFLVLSRDEAAARTEANLRVADSWVSLATPR